MSRYRSGRHGSVTVSTSECKSKGMGSNSISHMGFFRGPYFLLLGVGSAIGLIARLEPHSCPVVVVTSVPVFLPNPLP